MNARQLSEEIKETQQILSRLLESLERAQSQADSFSLFIFQERKKFQKVSNEDNTKHARDCQAFARESYVRAHARGYQGDYMGWLCVLKAYTPTVAPKEGA